MELMKDDARDNKEYLYSCNDRTPRAKRKRSQRREAASSPHLQFETEESSSKVIPTTSPLRRTPLRKRRRSIVQDCEDDDSEDEDFIPA